MNPESTLLTYFEQISAIPRASYKEDRIAQFLMDFAAAHGLEATRDASNNVLIRKSASPGYEHAPAVLLQGHTDMVCEKAASAVHDFDTDGIRVLRDGDFLHADGTTLGADDGYAVAAMLALLSEDTLPHPPLECLFTSSEEVGMDGMRNLDKSLLHARLMINLDSCEEASATASCAGGVRTSFSRNTSTEPYTGDTLQLEVSGLAGGHSGEEIDKERGNALKLCARLLRAVAADDGFALIGMDGGSKDNAIPRECRAVFTVSEPKRAHELLEAESSRIRAELGAEDSGFCASLHTGHTDGYRMTKASSDALLSLLCILPNGPQHMSLQVPGLVETSANTAIVHATPEKASVIVSSRSSVESRLDELCAHLETCASLCGFTCLHKNRYPAWAFRCDSKIQEIYRNSYRACIGKEPHIIGIHAGLECGLLSQELPDMDMISIGPDMFDIHTPAERLSISSALRVYELLLHMLASIH